MHFPSIYYLKKRKLAERVKRYQSVLQDKGQLERKLQESHADCMLVYETECASKQYRLDHAIEPLTDLGLHCVQVPVSHLDKINNFQWVNKFRLILLHRLPQNASLKRLLDACRTASTPVILDLDDAIYSPEIYRLSAVYDHLNSIEKVIHDDMARRVGKTLAQANLVTVSTEPLAEEVQELNRSVIVVPNRVSNLMLNAIAATPASSPQQPVIGYMCGTSTHHRDFETIAKALKNILTQNPKSKLAIAGPLTFGDTFFQEFNHRIDHFPLSKWPDFLNYYTKLTVNLAPLEVDNRFCQCKSGVKYLEAALSGIPTISAATPDFERLITPGQNGFIARSLEQWENYITYLIHNDSVRKAIGEAARSHVESSEVISSNKSIWKNVLEQVGVCP